MPELMSAWNQLRHLHLGAKMLHLLLAACFALVQGQQPPKELLYGLGGALFRTLDPATGEVLSSTYYGGTVFSPRGLAYDAGKLYSIDTNFVWLRDQLVEWHPATARHEDVGLTGYSMNTFVHLLRDPISGRCLAQYNESFWEIDLATGKQTFLSRLEFGSPIISATAIDARGVVYGISLPSGSHPAQSLYAIDPDTAQLHHLGDFPPSFVWITAAAFDAEDQLWASGVGPSSFQGSRLYRVNLERPAFEVAFPIDVGFDAMVFGPAPEVEGYCSSKPASTGCLPEIGWSGIPSATAHFGFEVSCSDVVNQAPGFLMLGLGGRASGPFEGGTLCVAPPILSTTPQASGGSPAGTLDCTGTWSLDVNTWLFANHPLAPGETFTCQWWGRDPGLAGSAASQLSDALEVVLFP